MFTGIVTGLGKIIKITPKGDSLCFTVQANSKSYLKDRKKGDSMSVNGACMTVESVSKENFRFTTVNESLSKTNLGNLVLGSYVNLEKPMVLSAGLDGHIVQGHVDTTGIVKDIIKLEDSWEFFFEFSSAFRKNVIYVGSVSINGISLTIAGITRETKKSVVIKTAIIPHTFDVTNFKFLKKGDKVNLEFDMLGKYVMRILGK